MNVSLKPPKENNATEGSVPARCEPLMKAMQKAPFFRELLPLETVLGLPVPLRRHGEVYAIFPCFRIVPSSQRGGNEIYPVFATIVVHWKSRSVVHFHRADFEPICEEQSPEDSIGVFPHEAIRTWTKAEYQEKRRELLQLYDQLFGKLMAGRGFEKAWKDRFGELLEDIFEPALAPAYAKIAPGFVREFLTR